MQDGEFCKVAAFIDFGSAQGVRSIPYTTVTSRESVRTPCAGQGGLHQLFFGRDGRERERERERE